MGDWCGPWSCCGGRPTASRPEIQCQEVEDLLSLLSCVLSRVKEKGDGAVRVVFRMGTGVGEVT